jgi:hypothetical protein
MAERTRISAPTVTSRPRSQQKPALAVRPAGDRFEREADRAADAVVGNRSSPPPLSPVPVPFIRKEKEERRSVEDGNLSRREAGLSNLPAAPSSVSDVLASSGGALDAATRVAMESRFHSDFSRVRIHTDQRAARSAQSIGARAYAAGENIVFGDGAYRPKSIGGRHVLAHELAHVVQQRGSGLDPIFVQRLNPLESIGVFFGLIEGDFSDEELTGYLDKVTTDGKIEDSYDSDNKARAIVLKWKASEPKFKLDPAQRVLLVKEMQSGPTLGGDEDRILDLLELSDIAALRLMFAPGALDVESLESDLGGDRFDRLEVFFTTRFKGGRDALKKGIAEPQHAPGKGAPVFAYDKKELRVKVTKASVSDLNEVAAVIFAFSPADRDKAIQDLALDRKDLDRSAAELTEKATKETDPLAKAQLQNQADGASHASKKREMLLKQVSRDIALTTSAADLTTNTVTPDAAMKAEVRKALSPEGGAALSFEAKLAGETKTYEQKMRDLMTPLLQAYYDQNVKDKGPVEHADQTKVRELTDFQRIGNASKDETDKVFGQYYDKSKKSELKADTATTRGNIHDIFADTEAELNVMDDDQKRLRARNFLLYIFQSDGYVRALNHAHHAAPQFDPAKTPLNDEAKSLATLADTFTGTPWLVERLNHIERGWVAKQRTGDISIQLFKKATPAKDREFLWDMFQTLIHEYIHTLKSDEYTKFAQTFGPSNEYNTLIEGVDSLLDEIVWENIAPRVNDPKLREIVEGPDDAKLPPIAVRPASQRRYPSYAEALKLVDLVGIQNLYAAYFLGDVKKIGG